MAFLDGVSDGELQRKIQSAQLDIEEAQAVIAACRQRLGVK